MPLETKDLATISISTFSLFTSLSTFFLTYRQKLHEDKRSQRKNLTDINDSLARVAIEFAKLDLSGTNLTLSTVNLRRNLNSQRSQLLNQASSLMKEIPELVTSVDHVFAAQAYEIMLDLTRAESHWKKCLELAPSPGLKATHLRGFARFCYVNGKAQDGRNAFSSSIAQTIGDGDLAKRMRSETYLQWALTELDFGLVDESARLAELASAEGSRISSSQIRAEWFNVLELSWKDPWRSLNKPDTH